MRPAELLATLDETQPRRQSLLHWSSLLLVHTLLFVMGPAWWAVDYGLGHVPSMLMYWLYELVQQPAWGWCMRHKIKSSPSDDDGERNGGLQPGQAGTQKRCGKRPRKKQHDHRHWLRFSRRAYDPASLRFKLFPMRMFARLFLLTALVCFSCFAAAGAMHTAYDLKSELAGTALQQPTQGTSRQYYCMPLPSPNQLLAESLVQLPSECFAAAGEADDPDAPWYNPNHTVLEALEPDGTPEDPHSANWSVHQEGQWILGNHPSMSPTDKQSLEGMLMGNKGAFAYGLDELPGYNGEPISFELIDPDKRMWSPQRSYTPDGKTFGTGKVKEMVDSGISIEIPTTNKHASAVTLPMKRAPAGQILLQD